MAAKLIKATAVTGQLVYAVIRRDADGFLMNDADGSFAASPVDFFFDLPEDGTVKGLYLATENRIPWANGSYSIIPYIQTGGSPVIVLDLPGEAEEMIILADTEITIEDVAGGTVTINSSLGGIKKSITSLSDGLAEILRQIRNLLDLILTLEKKIMRRH